MSDEAMGYENELISAMLDSGTYVPESFGIGSEHFHTMRAVHVFCEEYQTQAGKAPPVDLVMRSHPSFHFVSGVDPGWAAVKVKEDHALLVTQRAMAESYRIVHEERDVARALENLNKVSAADTTMKARSVFELTEEVPQTLPGWAVPWPALQRVTGGVKAGDLWYVAARLGEGKSWMLATLATHLASHGARVAFFSLEMLEEDVADRMAHVFGGMFPKIAAAHSYVPGLRTEARRAFMIDVAKKINGALDVMKPTRRLTPKDVDVTCRSYDVVMVDYVGLMGADTGASASEDWRVVAQISNSLKQAALRRRSSVIAAAQVNREGGKSSSLSSIHLAQSDSLGQDADQVVMCRRRSTSVMSVSVDKNRRGPNVKMHAHFDPKRGVFTEMDPAQVNTQISLDGGE